MPTPLWRHDVTKLETYVPGKSIEEVKKQYGLSEIIRLASNENPYGPSTKAIAAMQEAALQSHLYPEPTSMDLRAKLGGLYGIDPGQVLVSNGADNVLMLIGQAYINPGDEVVYCVPTFPVYRTSTVMMGGVPVEVAMTRDYKFDLDGMLARITDRTKLVYICNPNNPTGTIVESDDLEAFLRQVPEHIVVVLDEVYIDFVAVEGYRTGIEYIKAGYNVISVHSFSKLYGLAAARIGYALAAPDILAPLLAVREPFPVSRIANSAAIASLDDVEYRRFILDTNREGIRLLQSKLEALGLEIPDSYANFLFIDMKRPAAPVCEALLQAGFIVRPCKGWGYPNHIRVTVGSPEQNHRFIAELKTILHR